MIHVYISVVHIHPIQTRIKILDICKDGYHSRMFTFDFLTKIKILDISAVMAISK